ncbi:MAG: cation:proton antiporter [Gemmatimonadota bacterium]|nr:cation:proton antiporter [Gemmatimonadota bacterium]MDE3173076.1 cation:proton antiporter [Gemmatimonadota bacterium]MDE3216715.1 cation:proton antiporter [Gemmatimonadota bacterium]
MIGPIGLPLAPGGGEGTVAQLLAALAAIFVATKALGELAQRFRQPAVLGELVAGVLLGGSVLGVVDASNPVISAMAEIGVMLLLFEIGLETDVRGLIEVGGAATAVALAGVALPFGAAFVAAEALGLSRIPALVCGAALCATSVGISARVLTELGMLDTPEGRVVLGAAVLDDIIGVVILAVVAGIVEGGTMSAPHVGRIAGVAVAFVVAAVVVGARIAPPVFRLAEKMRAAGALGLVALAFAFVLGWLAHEAGSAMIIGAFAAGLVLHDLPKSQELQTSTTRIGHFFVPIFFASVGAAVNLRALMTGQALLVGGALIAVGILGKMAAGYVPWWFKGDKMLVGVAMVPRGEVGLIFAQMGLATGGIDAALYGAIMLMVLVTTFVTPPALGRAAAVRSRRRGVPSQPGIDDLVAGPPREP